MLFNFSGGIARALSGFTSNVDVPGNLLLDHLHVAGQLQEVGLELRQFEHKLQVCRHGALRVDLVDRGAPVNDLGLDLFTKARVQARHALLAHCRKVLDDALDCNFVGLDRRECLVDDVPRLMPILVEHL